MKLLNRHLIISFFTVTLTFMGVTSVFADETLAVVNGKNITESMLNTYAKQRGLKDPAKIQASQKKALVEEMINRELLYRVALEKNLDKQPDVIADLESAKVNLLAGAAMRKEIESQKIPSDNELKAEYEKEKAQHSSHEYKARHILLKTEKEANDVIAQLDKGGDFVKLAKQKSTGPSAKNGGDLGWFRPEQMVPEFAKAAAELKKGTYTKKPVKTQFGWHVIMLEDTRDVASPSFEAVKDQLRMKMLNQKMEQYVASLKSKAKIEMK